MSHSSFSILALFHQFLSQLKLSLIKFSRDQKHKNRKKKQLRMTSLNLASRFVFLLLISLEVTQRNTLKNCQFQVVSLLIEYYHEIFPVDISWENFDEGISELINEVKLCKMTCSLQEDSKSLEAPQASHSSKRASTVMTSLRKTFSQMTPNFEESKHSHNSKETSVLETTTE